MFWPLLCRRAHLADRHFLTWKKTKVKSELVSFLGYGCLCRCCFWTLPCCWAEALSHIKHKSEFWCSYKEGRAPCMNPHPCTWFLQTAPVIFTWFLFTDTSFTLSLSHSVLCVHIGTNKQARIKHSLKSCILSAIALVRGTQENQWWETTSPRLSNERSLGGKTVRVCPEQSWEQHLDGSISFCSYQTLTI